MFAVISTVADADTTMTTSSESRLVKSLSSLQLQTEVPQFDKDSHTEEIQPWLVALAVCAVVIMLIIVVIVTVLLMRQVKQCCILLRHRRAIPPCADIEMQSMVDIRQPEHRPVQATSDQFSPSPVSPIPFVREQTNSLHDELVTRQNSG